MLRLSPVRLRRCKLPREDYFECLHHGKEVPPAAPRELSAPIFRTARSRNVPALGMPLSEMRSLTGPLARSDRAEQCHPAAGGPDRHGADG